MMALTLIASGDVKVDASMPERDRVRWRDAARKELESRGYSLTLKGGHFPKDAEHNSEAWHHERRELPRKYELTSPPIDHPSFDRKVRMQLCRGTLQEVCKAAVQALAMAQVVKEHMR